MKEETLNPPTYPPLGPQDEAFIKAGIHKAETTSIHSTSSINTSSSTSSIPISASPFTPTKTFYINRHNLFSKEISILDITTLLTTPYSGGEITDEYRDAARALAESLSPTTTPIYQVKRKHWYNRTAALTSPSSLTPTAELATWKHGVASYSKAELTFPPQSPHSAHPITMAPTKFYHRTNAFTLNSVPYTYKCDSRFKANRITLFKQVAGKNIVVARYAQRWGSWITGGVLLVDARGEAGVDEVVVVLSTVVMLRRMQQRAAERTHYSGGGGGGGGGE